MTGFSTNKALNSYDTGSFSATGRRYSGSFSLPVGATLVEANQNSLYRGIEANAFSDGERVALSTSVDITLDRGASPSNELGSKYMHHVSYTQATATFNTGKLYSSPDIDQKFLDGAIVDLVARSERDGKVFSFGTSQARITDGSKTVDTGDVQQAFNVQGFGTGKSLIIRRLDTTV